MARKARKAAGILYYAMLRLTAGILGIQTASSREGSTDPR
jgi:hypothetical protein